MKMEIIKRFSEMEFGRIQKKPLRHNIFTGYIRKNIIMYSLMGPSAPGARSALRCIAKD